MDDIMNLALHRRDLDMLEAETINTELVETLTQIIFSLTEKERQLLLCQFQDPDPGNQQTLVEQLTVASEQMRSGEFNEYTDATLPSLLDKIRERGQQRLDHNH
jgi:hypothetical protein